MDPRTLDFRLLFESAPGSFLVLDPGLRIVGVSERYLRATMTKREAILGRGLFEVFPDDPLDPAADGVRNLRRSLDVVLGARKADTMAVQKYAVRRPDGSFEERHWSPVNTPVLGKRGEVLYIIHSVEDVTEFVRLSDGVEREVYRRAQEIKDESRRLLDEQERLRDQLLQAQKLEAIGRLAGGIAHDFNNILTAISGYSELLLADLRGDDPRRTDIQEISRAGERAAGLTRQLLAFSRRQLLSTRVLDPNAVVRGVEPMLSRLIGEDVSLSLALRADSGRVRADSGQLEQVIVNLALNARDAMPKGGKLAIETARVELEGGWHDGPELSAGSYVMLAVSDTGVGMDAETLARVFEPFFTTKEQGKGTGLGLATVYGIVKQSGGGIFAYSEPGQGSCFKVFLPRVEAEADPVERPASAHRASARGTETILLVEDDAAVRKLVRRVLEQSGYRVLEAGAPDEALRLCEKDGGRIGLLLTDVVMPGMRGDDLARAIGERHPQLKVVFTSGYTQAGITERRLLGEHDAFIQKPIHGANLLRVVRDVLDAPRVP